MNKPNRLKKNDKVEIIDRSNPDFGKIAKFSDARIQNKQMINGSSKVISQKVVRHDIFKLEDTGKEIELTPNQWRKI